MARKKEQRQRCALSENILCYQCHLRGRTRQCVPAQPLPVDNELLAGERGEHSGGRVEALVDDDHKQEARPALKERR
jgi:hypothetical protein